MIDREKVFKWLEICGKNKDCSQTCPYGDGSGEYEDKLCREDLMADALELLKEQEPKLVIKDRYGIPYCPHCSTQETRDELSNKLAHGMNYCPYCGKAVKFDEGI